jgi:HAD superfamily hydrolase (TIGR01509 family)
VTHKALIWDFDGTIIDSEWPHFVASREACKHYGVQLTLDYWQSRIGIHNKTHWSQIIIDDVGEPADFTFVLERARDHKNAMTLAQPIRDGVSDLFRDAHAAGVPIAVASSSSTSWVGPHLERLSLAQYVTALRTRDDVKHAKPWPDVFLAAAEALALEPADCLVVEDSSAGVQAAKDAGMTCVVCPNPVTEGQDFSRADLVVSSVAEIPRDFLASLAS